MSGLHVKAVYTRTRTAGAEDVAVTTHDLWHDSSDWTDAQMDAVAAPFVTFWQTLCTAGHIAAPCRLIELRMYKGYDGDGSPGAVDRVKTYSVAGTGSGMLPPQVACTFTELTDSRRHWGRFYLPGIDKGTLQLEGTMGSVTSAFANAAETMYEAWGALPDNTTPIVWSRSSHPIEYLAVAPPRWRPSWMYPSGTVWDEPVALAVQSIRVDEILDVQRPRRYQSTQNRQTRVLG